ncbi:MAG: hypothetical protein HZC29_08430 [Thaumarchaeota archaeon]|nr:hypothetical protein [Nitrososphaerota archaeon]
MKGLVIAVLLLVASIAIIPVYGTVVEFKTDKTSYKKGDKIIFSGKTDLAHANKMVSVKVIPPQGKSFLLVGGRSDANGVVEIKPVDTIEGKAESKMTMKGIYNASLIYDEDPLYKGKWTIFDYSLDGSPVSPSAADIMGQQSSPAPTQPTQPTQPTTPTTPTQPTQPTTPKQEEPVKPSCGTGTVYDEETETCIVAPANPEPEEEPTETETQTGYKTTHIPGFPDPTKTPESYVERYQTDAAFKSWFDKNFPDDIIYDIVGVEGPKTTHIPGFPDPTKDPQSYVDRYQNDAAFKSWFDKNFPDDTIYEIVGVDEPQPPSACGPGTHDENGICVLDKKEGIGQCAIATAAFGTELAPQVQLLREVRDNVLFSTGTGTAFMAGFNDFYYTFSPTIADWERQSPVLKEIVKATITPMLSTLSILNYVDVDSEQEMLGYGIGVMLLNVGMYFVAPALVIISVRKHLKF